MAKPFFDKYAKAIWASDKLIDEFQVFLYRILGTTYNLDPLTPEDFFEQLKPIRDKYRLPHIGDDDQLIDDRNYSGFIERKINSIKSNAHLREITPARPKPKPKSGLANISPFLAWLDECQPDESRNWFEKVQKLYRSEGRQMELAFLSNRLRSVDYEHGSHDTGFSFPETQSSTADVDDHASNIISGEREPSSNGLASDIGAIDPTVLLGTEKAGNQVSIVTESEADNRLIEENEKRWVLNGWKQPKLMPSPQIGECWKVLHEWTPAKVRSLWMGISRLIYGLPTTKSYRYRATIWTGDYLRTVVSARLVFPVLISFRLGHKRGTVLFARQDRDDFKPQLASANGSSESFVFSDRLGFVFAKNVDHDSLLAQLYFKLACGETVFSRNASRHPYSNLKLGRTGYHEEPVFVALSADSETIIFSHYSRGPKSHFRRAIDVYRYEDFGLTKLEEWEKSFHTVGDLTPHPSISRLFFRSPNIVIRVGGGLRELNTGTDWLIASGTNDLAWHSTLPLIIVTSYLSSEDKRHALQLIDTETGACLKEHISTDGIVAVAWSPDGRTVMFSTKDHGLCKWDLENDQIERIFSNNCPVSKIEFSPSGDRVAIQDWHDPRRIAIFSVEGFDELTAFDGTFENFNSTPWHYLGRDIGYIFGHQIRVRRLQYENDSARRSL